MSDCEALQYILLRLSNPVWSVNAPTASSGVERREVDSRIFILPFNAKTFYNGNK